MASLVLLHVGFPGRVAAATVAGNWKRKVPRAKRHSRIILIFFRDACHLSFSISVMTRHRERRGLFSPQPFLNFKFPRSLNRESCLETAAPNSHKTSFNCNPVSFAVRSVQHAPSASLVHSAFHWISRTCHRLRTRRSASKIMLGNVPFAVRIFHSFTFFTFP